ncbi:hypothetical protein GCM10018793_58070 [Streptomyces sulfonofaciens]|uniref:Uncharacterized protein n=1 Tax=Streptomyces sulfonofaciens TaxID=68272 RepID=A0A919GLU2_9ACTN|nr:hypothetical protein GCM10018793_58070 [Streptomyces sulfonofaciens]
MDDARSRSPPEELRADRKEAPPTGSAAHTGAPRTSGPIGAPGATALLDLKPLASPAAVRTHRTHRLVHIAPTAAHTAHTPRRRVAHTAPAVPCSARARPPCRAHQAADRLAVPGPRAASAKPPNGTSRRPEKVAV